MQKRNGQHSRSYLLAISLHQPDSVKRKHDINWQSTATGAWLCLSADEVAAVSLLMSIVNIYAVQYPASKAACYLEAVTSPQAGWQGQSRQPRCFYTKHSKRYTEACGTCKVKEGRCKAVIPCRPK